MEDRNQVLNHLIFHQILKFPFIIAAFAKFLTSYKHKFMDIINQIKIDARLQLYKTLTIHSRCVYTRLYLDNFPHVRLVELRRVH